MDPRKLKRLLDTYREAGVSKLELDEKLQPRRLAFFAALPTVSGPDVNVEAGWTEGAPMGLQQAVARIQKAYEKPQKGRAS